MVGHLVAVVVYFLISACGNPSPTGPSVGETVNKATTEVSPAVAEPSTSRTTGPGPDTTTTVTTVTTVTVATAPPAPPDHDTTVAGEASRPTTVAEPTDPVNEALTPEQSGGVLPMAILDTLPHDAEAFTQGLALRNGRFYESTGLYGASSIRIVDPGTGEILSSVALDDRYFGEGLEVVSDRVVQLTWKEQTALIWDAATLEPLGTYTYDGEGWGLCAFEDSFVMSDGSSTLTFRDLDSFEVIGTVDVAFAGEPVDRLNELECVGELVLANVWFSDEIVVIAADSGNVLARVDASSLRAELSSGDGIDALNGIAYDPDRRVFYLTGKLWPEIFVVRIGEDP